MATGITRGSTVIFAVVFKDQDGNVINPASANLYVEYRLGGVVTIDTVAMTPGVSNWTAAWQSSLADGGRADWHVRSAGTNKAALQGTLQLETNLANPAPP